MPAAALKRRVLFGLATRAAFERAVRAAPGGEARAWRSGRRYVAGSDVMWRSRLSAQPAGTLVRSATEATEQCSFRR